MLVMRDGFPKYIISKDSLTLSNNGIKRLNLVKDFLLEIVLFMIKERCPDSSFTRVCVECFCH